MDEDKENTSAPASAPLASQGASQGETLQGQQAQPSPEQPAAPKSSGRKLLLIGGAVIVVLLLAGTGTFAYQKYQAKQQAQPTPKPTAASELPPAPPPVPSPESTGSVETANWKTSKLGNLEFKIPQGWWSRQHRDDQTGKEWIMIHPTSLEGNPEPLPLFTLNFSPNTNIEDERKNLIKAYPLTVQRLEPAKVASTTSEKLKGKVPYGPLENKDITIVFIPFKGGIYYLVDIGVISNHIESFDQILSTFQFTN